MVDELIVDIQTYERDAPFSRGADDYGSRAMAELAEVIRRKFDIGLLSTSQHRFFEALGWERWRGPTFVVRDGEFVRTADEDDGIMALRFGPSAGVSLAKPIACRAREGDDW